MTQERQNTSPTQPIQAQQFDVIEPAQFAPSDGSLSKTRIYIKPLSIIVASLLLIGASVVWFLFAAKSVIVTTSPLAENMHISGGLKFELEGHYVMLPGNYQLTATLPGYYPISTRITVSEQQNQTVAVDFKKLPGSLTVKTQDDIIADIYIDGQKLGQSNQKVADIAAGEHQLKIQSARYFPITQKVVIEGMEKHQTLPVTLIPAWAAVTLSSQPGGATLSADGTSLGATPFDGTLLEGKHQLALTLPGYKTWTQELNVKAGVDIALPVVYLEKSDGILELTSSPEGVGITMDGRYQGQTPLTIALSPNQNHRLSLFKDGYQQQQQAMSLKPGEQQELNIRLKPVLGQLTVHADQEDALLYVDGTLMGKANKTVTLTAKRHLIEVKKPGFVDYQTHVLPRMDLQQIVDVRMKTLEQARWESYPAILTTGVDSQMKLFKPKVVFTMGASRREQGRRANEVRRRISLKRPFYLGLKEITNAEYRHFAKEHSSGHLKGNSLNGDQQPVVSISWKEAALFCNWLSAKDKLPAFYRVEDGEIVGTDINATGYRLPTEAEWTWAARYDKGQMLKYSWGRQLPPKPNSGNFADRSGAAILGFIQASYDDSYPVSAPVGSYPANGKGLFDLDGNVAEWINDFYEVKTGLTLKIEKDPMGAEKGDYHVIRGSSWAHGTMTELRLSFRDYGQEPRNDIGFRIARFVEPLEAQSE